MGKTEVEEMAAHMQAFDVDQAKKSFKVEPMCISGIKPEKYHRHSKLDGYGSDTRQLSHTVPHDNKWELII